MDTVTLAAAVALVGCAALVAAAAPARRATAVSPVEALRHE
jgi:ABC-type antimicrobial peptide transport system permease subunit